MRNNNMRKISYIFFCIVFIFFLLVAIYMRPFGEPKERAMDEYMINNGQNETGANNIVTSVVFDYRGYDTLGEATVLFTAVTGVLIAFRKLKGA